MSVLKALPFTDVTITDNFWAPHQLTNSQKTISHQLEQCRITGRIDNFAKAGGLIEGEFEGIFFNDSDVYKLVEAASYTLWTHPHPPWEGALEDVITKIAKSQQPDGYINTYFTLVEPTKRWQNLGMMHELYCAGHLFEAGVAHYQATSQNTLLDVATRFAEHIYSIFGDGKRDGIPGHEEIELALVKLSGETDEPRYFELAKFFLTRRGQSPSIFEKELQNPDIPGGLGAYQHHFTREGKFDGSYAQAHLPLEQQTECVGHAVRAMYLYAGAADIAAKTGNPALIDALEHLWRNITEKRIYITGGIGPSPHNEGFTTDYELPNFSAYAETCASIGLIFWAHRMFLLQGESGYVDVLENALYNGVLSGIALDGTSFFYQNPLASHGNLQRQSWFSCACCPPNISRLLASLGQYIYAQDDEDIWINLYIAGSAAATVQGNIAVQIRQETEYPRHGDIKLTLTPAEPVAFTANLRIPDWCDEFAVRINGKPHTSQQSSPNGYLSISREWRPNDTVELTLSMPIMRIYAHTLVRENLGRFALRRGPLVYCFEECDNPDGIFQTLAIHENAELETAFNAELLGGITQIRGTGVITEITNADNKLYRRIPPKQKPIEAAAIPYYAWGNRDKGQMAVWVRAEHGLS